MTGIVKPRDHSPHDLLEKHRSMWLTILCWCSWCLPRGSSSLKFAPQIQGRHFKNTAADIPADILCLISLLRKDNRATLGPFGSPLSKSDFVPATPPDPLIISVFFVPKPNTHSDVTCTAVVRVLEALLIRFTHTSTFFKRRCLGLHPAGLSKFSSF